VTLASRVLPTASRRRLCSTGATNYLFLTSDQVMS